VVLTRSKAEERFRDLILKAQLPAPLVNVKVRGLEVDFLWRAERLVAEVDGFAYHSSPRSFEDDRHKDACLAAAGMQVIRVTWRQIVREPEAVVVRLAQILAQRRPPARTARPPVAAATNLPRPRVRPIDA
jgi:very-short-patch-repair endonuclease